MLLIYLRMSKEEYGLGSHDGIAQVVGDKAVLVEENHDASKMMSFGKDVFSFGNRNFVEERRRGIAVLLPV